MRVAGTQRLDFRVGQRCFIHVVTGAGRAFAGHNLADELLLVLHRLPQISVKRRLGDVAVDVHVLVPVALTNDSPRALLQIPRPPRAVKVVRRGETILYVGPRAHFCGAAHQDAHLPAAYLREKLLLPHFRVRFVDKGNLLLRDALRNQFSTNVIIHVEVLAARFVRQKRVCIRRILLRSRLAARGGQVAENQLRQLFRRPFAPDADNVLDAGVDLAARIIRKKRIHQPLVKP